MLYSPFAIDVMRSRATPQLARADGQPAGHLLSRYLGCLIGLATGDALGAPVEHVPPGEIRAKYGVLTEMVGGGWLFVAPGEPTDDTQLAVAVATSLVERQGFDPVDLAKRFVDWASTSPKDVSNTMRVALNLLRAGHPWLQAGVMTNERLHGYTAGNGALMRAAPIALAARRLPVETIVRWADEASLITHWDQRARWAAIALDLGIVAALQGTPKDRLAGVVASQVEEPEVRAALEAVATLGQDAVRTTGYAIHTLQAAFWCVGNRATFEDAVVTAVNFGDDADTTGAVTGALAGASHGVESIPGRWRQALKADQSLVALAEQLLRLSESLAPDRSERAGEAQA